MPLRFIVLFRAIGGINMVICALGLYGGLTTTTGFLAAKHFDPKQPYFYQALVVMGAFNLAFIAMICLISYDLIRLRVASVKAYLWVVAALICYDFVNAGLCFLPRGVGMSIGGATGVGNEGIEPFQFGLFFIPWGWPVLSAAALYFGRRKLAAGKIQNPQGTIHFSQ